MILNKAKAVEKRENLPEEKSCQEGGPYQEEEGPSQEDIDYYYCCTVLPAAAARGAAARLTWLFVVVCGVGV